MNRTHSIAAVIFLLVLTAARSAPAWGQATSELRGAVMDPSGASIANANITLTNTDTNLERKTVSAADGSYGFHEMLPGITV